MQGMLNIYEARVRPLILRTVLINCLEKGCQDAEESCRRQTGEIVFFGAKELKQRTQNNTPPNQTFQY